MIQPLENATRTNYSTFETSSKGITVNYARMADGKAHKLSFDDNLQNLDTFGTGEFYC